MFIKDRGIREEMIEIYMIKELKIDKINGMAVLEIAKNDLRNLMESDNNMVDKQQRTLLENLPLKNQIGEN